MKRKCFIPAIIIGILVLATSATNAQQIQYGKMSVSIGGQAINLVGDNTDHSEIGPFFRGRFGYEVAKDVTILVESGYGWTGHDENDDIKAMQVPIIAGAMYDFGSLLNSPVVRPYLGAGAGLFIARLENDGELVEFDGEEQKLNNFGIEGMLGVQFRLMSMPLSIDINAKYDYVFSEDEDYVVGIKSQNWSAIGFGAGITYYF